MLCTLGVDVSLCPWCARDNHRPRCVSITVHREHETMMREIKVHETENSGANYDDGFDMAFEFTQGLSKRCYADLRGSSASSMPLEPRGSRRYTAVVH